MALLPPGINMAMAGGGGGALSGLVTSGGLGPGAVLSGNIASGQVGWPHLASGAVRSGHIGDGAVVSGSIASGSIGPYHLASGVIQPAALTSGSVRSGHLGDGAVVSGSIASGQISSSHFASGTILPPASGAIQSGMLGAGAVQSANIGSGQVGIEHLASGVLQNFVLTSGIVQSGHLGNGAVVSGSIASGQVSSSHFASGTILPNQITSGGIVSGMMGDGAVVSNAIASGQIGLHHLASGVIQATALTSGAVTSGFIGNGAVVSGSVASGSLGPYAFASGVLCNCSGTIPGPVGPTCAVATYNDAAYHTIETVPITDNTVVLLEAEVVGRRTDSPDRAGYIRRALIYREAGGAATIQGTLDSPLTRESDTVWNARIVVSGNDALIQVRGDTGQTVNWKACWKATVSQLVITTSDGAYHTAATLAMPDDTVWLLRVSSVGRRTDAAARAGYLREAVVFREGGGNATIQSTVATPLTRESVVAWDVTIGVSGSNVLINVRGAAGQTVNWNVAYTVEEIG